MQSSNTNEAEEEVISFPKKVAVAGATGRTGKYVVKELLMNNVEVVALVRDIDKANEMFSEYDSSSIDIIKCDLGSEKDIKAAVNGCGAAIWCATGFSNVQNESILDKLKKLWDLKIAPKTSSIDFIGISALASTIMETSKSESQLPKIVMLSSAGVTRPSWPQDKKEMLKGAADIPIVRLNPFDILNIKAQSEDNLRQMSSSSIPYCIVRPCGLNDDWPSGLRPIITQGDVGVGRINRQDVAKVLVQTLVCPEALGKTFEVIGLAGYNAASSPSSIRSTLSRLRLDSEGPISEEQVIATYNVMQQLLPGEKQDSAALAMGQTYEQLDKDEVGRFGERGKEDLLTAAPVVTSQ